MDLEVGALTWGSTRYRVVEPPEEYARRAREAQVDMWWLLIGALAPIETADALRLMVGIVFLETVGEPGDGWSIGKAGFYSHATPDRVFIVTDKAPLDEVAWWVRHEMAHAIHYLLAGDASKGPQGEAFADELAGPDVPAGHAVWRSLTADRLVMFPPSWLTAEILPAIGAGDEVLALPARATGITVTHGKITVTNPGGTAIIDGQSNIHKIAYTAACTWPAVSSGWGYVVTTITLALGLGVTPAANGYVYAPAGGNYQAIPCPFVVPGQYGEVDFKREIGAIQSGSDTVVYLMSWVSYGVTIATATGRLYVEVEAAL